MTETTLKDCLKVGIEAQVELSTGFTAGLEPGKTVPVDKCKIVTPSQTRMYNFLVFTIHGCRKIVTTKSNEQFLFVCFFKGDNKSEPLIDKVISSVKGGSTQSAAAMKSQLSKDGMLDINHYIEWARTLSDIPALIQSDVSNPYLII